jgi:hypothetical protein
MAEECKKYVCRRSSARKVHPFLGYAFFQVKRRERGAIFPSVESLYPSQVGLRLKINLLREETGFFPRISLSSNVQSNLTNLVFKQPT